MVKVPAQRKWFEPRSAAMTRFEKMLSFVLREPKDTKQEGRAVEPELRFQAPGI